MRPAVALVALAVAGVFTPTARAADTPHDIIDRAIKARVGESGKLEKQRVEVITYEGTVTWNQFEAPTSKEVQVEWPTQYRMFYDIMAPDGKKRITLGLSADKGWIQQGGAPPEEMNFVRVEEYKADVYGQWMATLYPLKDRAITLTRLKDAKVGDEPVNVVKASARFRPDVFLSFSQKTGHLVRLVFRAPEAGVEIRKEQQFADFKTFDGLVLPGKVTEYANGKKAAELTVKSYQFPEKLGPNPFEEKKDEKK